MTQNKIFWYLYFFTPHVSSLKLFSCSCLKYTKYIIFLKLSFMEQKDDWKIVLFCLLLSMFLNGCKPTNP